MATLITSSQAELDLLEIWLYISEDSPVNADRFLGKINNTVLRLAEFNDMGVERPELADNLSSFPLDRYVIYYRKTDEGIELVRVLNSSRDIDSLF
jgi:toxin ParE1/3/4